MQHFTKTILIFSLILLGLGVFWGISAQENNSSILEEEITAADLNLKEPTLLPDNPFYFLKNWSRGIQSLFTFDKVKNAELKQKFADERLLELKKLVENNAKSEVIQKATENYKKELEKIKNEVEKIKDKADTNPTVDKFLDKFTNQQILHEKILEKLEDQVTSEVYIKIKEAREQHLEKFGEVMTKLENRTEKIKERVEKSLEEQEGSKYKNFKNLEVLLEIEKKVPEQAKEAIRQAQENALNHLNGDLSQMSPEDQEKFKSFLGQIYGDKENQLEILQNIKLEIKDNPQLEEKLEQAREKILEKIRVKNEQKNCPLIETPNSDFCKDGRILPQRDENGCIVDYNCLIPGETEKPTQVCIMVWDPVCGKDGKTYSNECFARIAGVQVDYKGVCGEKECQTDDDCPQPNCGTAGTSAANCVGMQARCINGKCSTVNASPTSNCNYYYWFDDNNRDCSYKRFCGAFMYQGLRTFRTRKECLAALLTAKKSCTTDADCGNPNPITPRSNESIIQYRCVSEKCELQL